MSETEKTPTIHTHDSLTYHRRADRMSDDIAYKIVRLLARLMDLVFGRQYGHRAVVLETIAAVPGMVGGLVQHLTALRRIRDDKGWIKTLLDEAENERMHLMVYSQIAKPSLFDRFLIIVAQFFFYHLYLVVYLISPRTGHRAVGYLEEEAIHSYTVYLDLVDAGEIANSPAPKLAIDYWGLAPEARLRDVVIATRKDEVNHRDVNHTFADDLRK